MKEPECKRFRTTGPLIDHNQEDSEESDCLSEADVGICAFLSDESSRFECTLKNRWEDFIVREVIDGVAARLTDLTPILGSTSTLDELDKVALDFLKPHMTDLNAILTDRNKVVKFTAPNAKSERAAIHTAIRVIFPSLSSTTVTEDGTLLIVVAKSGNRSVVPKRSDRRIPSGMPYCRFVLYKEGKDTISTISVISSHLHLSPGSFTYAGTKDRRAITTQFITVKNIESRRLAALNHVLRGIRLGNFAYVSKPLFLGRLDGNQFVIVLRSVSAPLPVIQGAVEMFKSHGFINYYGLQRFGHSVKSKSFDIGRYLIQGDWVKAIDLILTPTDADPPAVRQIKKHYIETGDACSCAANAPPSVEKHLLQGVAKHGKNLNALQMLPRNLRQLYVHSYQSLVWNRIATRRILQFGASRNHSQPGDLYYSDTLDQLLDPGDCDRAASTDFSTPVEPKVATVSDCHSIPLTQVVLPLPGFDVVLPKNECGQWYYEALGEDGLTIDDLKHRVKDFSLPGSYRSLVVVPKDVNFRVVGYSDPNTPLVKSDLQLLTESVSPVQSESSAEDHPYRAIVLQFTLPKSSYATMAVRELAKRVSEKR